MFAKARKLCGEVGTAFGRGVEKCKAVAAQVGVATVVGVGSTVAHAQTATTFDVSSAVTLINGDIKTAVMQVGTAVIGLAAVAMGIRWVKATFF